jgi:curved DNA-binding protein CbpA
MEKQLEEALQVLGIPADSDRRTVTGAYRRLARATHPDVSPNPDAAERFATVAAAYRLVSGVPEPGHHVRRRSEDLTDPRSTPASGGARFLLGAWPVRPAGPWYRPPIVAGPVVVRGVQPDGGSRDG